jgi:hypothetical protein
LDRSLGSGKTARVVRGRDDHARSDREWLPGAARSLVPRADR